MASDAFGNLTQDVSTEIDEGTVAALISQSFDDLGDMDASDDVIQSSFVPPRITPLCIEQHGLGEWAFAEGISYEVRELKVVCADILALNLRESFSMQSVLKRAGEIARTTSKEDGCSIASINQVKHLIRQS